VSIDIDKILKSFASANEVRKMLRSLPRPVVIGTAADAVLGSLLLLAKGKK